MKAQLIGRDGPNYLIVAQVGVILIVAGHLPMDDADLLLLPVGSWLNCEVIGKNKQGVTTVGRVQS